MWALLGTRYDRCWGVASTMYHIISTVWPAAATASDRLIFNGACFVGPAEHMQQQDRATYDIGVVRQSGTVGLMWSTLGEKRGNVLWRILQCKSTEPQ